MRYKIFILSLLMMICTCFVNAYADEKLDVQVDKTTYVINVSGDLGTTFSNKRVILYCVKENDSNVLESDENVQYKTGLFKIFRQGTTNENGAYLFENLKINSSVGDNYVFYLSVENGTNQIVSDAIYIPSVVEINGFLQKLSSGDKTVIYSALENELASNKIGINIPLYVMLNDEGRQNVAAKIVESTYLSVGDAEAFINPNSIENCLYNIKNVQNLDKLLFPDLYSELNDYKTAIAEKNGYAAYKAENPQGVVVLEKLAVAERNKIYDKLDMSALNNATDFYNSLSVNIINYEFDNVSGYGDVSTILKKYSTTTLKDMNYNAYLSCKYKNEINEDILEKDFNSTDKLCSFINSSVISYNDKEQNGNAGNTPSGGGSGGGAGGNTGGYGGSSGLGVSAPPSISETESGKQSAFKDLKGYDWAKTAIECLYEKGAISGTGNGEFRPEREVTREEFVKMLLLALDYKIESGNSEFGDVTNEDWFAPYIYSATKNGIINGIADGKFGVGMPITREDAAVLIWRVAGKNNTVETGFADNAEVSDYAKSAVNWLKGTGIVSGYEDGTFRPANMISRAETAKILWTFYEKR